MRQPATREEVALTLVEALNIKMAKTLKLPFSDVDAASMYAPAISALAADNVLLGDTDASGNPIGRLRPNDPVIRAEVAVIAWRLNQAGFTKALITARPATRRAGLSCSAEATTEPQPAANREPEPVANAGAGSPYVVTVYALNVRFQPNITAPRYTALSAGAVVTLLDTIADTWAHIRLADGTEGYVGLSGIAPR